MCQIFNSSKIVVDEAALSDGNRIFRYNIELPRIYDVRDVYR